MAYFRILARPFGHLAFALALLTLSGAARLLGEKHELGFFSGRLASTIWRYPEVTRHGIQMVWLTWALLLALALSPLDPLATEWDEAVLALVGLTGLWRRLSGRRGSH